MTTSAQERVGPPTASVLPRDLLEDLGAISDAVSTGAGLPEVVRAAAKALQMSAVVLDAAGAVLAVAARSTADERALLERGRGVQSVDLRVDDTVVGELRLRGAGAPVPALVRVAGTLVACELERVRAPQRATQEAARQFLQGLLATEPPTADDLRAMAAELRIDLTAGTSMLVVRAHSVATAEEGWRTRALSAVERGVRAVATTAIAAPSERDTIAAEILVLVPDPDQAIAQRSADAAIRELQAALPSAEVTVGRSRVAADAGELTRAANEALLAANVAEGAEGSRSLAFDETGAYRLLLSAMSEDPAELQRFYSETVEPLVAYDEQYDTELVLTASAFLDNDGNVAGTAQKLFTHRHTIRYRLERVRELSGLDVSSSDGRERLSLGLKAMRVLGVAAPSRVAPDADASARARAGRRRGSGAAASGP